MTERYEAEHDGRKVFVEVSDGALQVAQQRAIRQGLTMDEAMGQVFREILTGDLGEDEETEDDEEDDEE